MILGREQHWAEPQCDDPYRDMDGLALNVEPGERIGPPLPSRYRAVLRKMLFGTALLAVGWVVATDEGGPDSWVTQAKALVGSAVENARRLAERPSVDTAAALADEGGASGVAAMQGEPAAEANAVVLPPVVMQTPVAEAAQDREEAPPADAIGQAYSEKAEEVQDKSPERKRAVAVGLGADLPNVLLTRLNTGDLENAAYAIKTAMAKTPDDGSFSWPPSPASHQASFEVRFVQGAAEGCRRYVVKVTKERWSSTSAALEKCAGGASGAG